MRPAADREGLLLGEHPGGQLRAAEPRGLVQAVCPVDEQLGAPGWPGTRMVAMITGWFRSVVIA
jgi:hypothetical protein